MTALKDDGGEPDLPALDAALQPFVSMLFEAGPVSNAGQGQVTLTWADLNEWQRGIRARLPPWQLRLLRRLSSEYLMEMQRADAPDAVPPWEVVEVPKWKRQQNAMRKLAKL